MAAAHLLAQPAFPRDQPTWPVSSSPSYCFSPKPLSTPGGCSTPIDRRIEATATLRCHLALKCTPARPEANPRSISPPPHLVIVGARTSAERRRHRRELPRPLSSPAPATVSVGAAADVLVTARGELDREPLCAALPRRFPLLHRRSSPFKFVAVRRS